LFPDNYFVFRAEYKSTHSNVTRGGGALTEAHRSFSSCKRTYDLELANECVWIEIPVPDGFNLLVGNHYFPPDADAKVSENYFNSLETNLNPQSFRVVLLGDFNVPGYDWVNGFPQDNTHYYIKLRGDVIHNSTCYLGLSQYNLISQNKNLLDLVFANFSNANVYNYKFDLVEPVNPLLTPLSISLTHLLLKL
jgi:hypothetical protein